MAGLTDLFDNNTVLWPFKSNFYTISNKNEKNSEKDLSELLSPAFSFNPEKVSQALSAVGTIEKPSIQGLFDMQALASLVGTDPTQERQKIYKQAMGSLLGSALAGLLGAALIGGRAGDIFGAGAVSGGMNVANYMLQEQLEKEKLWQNFKNQLATKLITLNLDYLADTLKDERKAEKYRAYSEKLKEIYPQFVTIDDKGNTQFDFVGFTHAASILGLQMGLDPNQFKELRDAFVNALETVDKLEKNKWEILERIANIGKTQAETKKIEELIPIEKTKEEKQAEYYGAQAEWIKKGKPVEPRTVVHISSGKEEKIDKQKLLKDAINAAQKDPRYLMARTQEERNAIVREYYENFLNLLGPEKSSQPSKQTTKPAGSKITVNTLYQLLGGK